jgi:hypothetical protein
MAPGQIQLVAQSVASEMGQLDALDPIKVGLKQIDGLDGRI